MNWRAIVPVGLLLAVAIAQVALTRTANLSPWKGGGFGMFSTTDDAGRRGVRVFVTAVDRSEELEVPPSLEDEAKRAAVLPTDARLTRFARLIVDRERRHQRPVDTVRIETWGISYAPGTLAATTRLLRQYEYRVDPAASAHR